MKFRILFIVLMVLSVFGGISAQDESADLRFFMSYIPNIQFAPVYVAVAKDYFADEGINLLIEHGDENIGVEQIAINDISFGIIGGDQVVLARAGERPVVMVYQWFQSYPVGVVIPSTVEAESFADLMGMRVGVPGRFGVNYMALNALLAANEMTEEDIQLTEIGYVAPDVVCGGNVDAAVIYTNNEPLEIQRRADAGECGDITGVSLLPMGDDLHLASNGIATNEETIETNPELVQSVVTAFDMGLRDAINNPAEAYLLSAEFVENLPLPDELRDELEAASAAQEEFLATEPDAEAIAESRDALYADLSEKFEPEVIQQFLVLLETVKLWESEQLGFNDPEAWEATLQVLSDMEMLSGEVELEDAYTNDFVPDESGS